MTTFLNRRQWLKAAGATLAASALVSPARLLAQAPAPAPRRQAALPGLIRLNYNENPFGHQRRARAARPVVA